LAQAKGRHGGCRALAPLAPCLGALTAEVFNTMAFVPPPAGAPSGPPMAHAAPLGAGAGVGAAPGSATPATDTGQPVTMEMFQAVSPTGQGQMSSHSKPLAIIPLCRKGDRAGIEIQLQAGATVHETDNEGNTPLHVAVEAPKNEIATVQCLLENGANANACNYIGATPLHYVCLRKSNYRGVANILLENGAIINSQTVAGKSPLHFACENQLPELAEVLCLFGADTNLVDCDGNTPIHLALIKEGGRDTVKRQIVEHLLAYRANPSVFNKEGLSPAHLACRAGYVRCVQLMVDSQGDIRSATAYGQTGLHLACLGGHAEVAQLLLQVFPESLDMADLEGNTALHNCAVVGNLDCALLLLKVDANTTLRNNQKKTAFDLAKIRGTDLNSTHNPELVQVLKDAKKGGGCRQS